MIKPSRVIVALSFLVIFSSQNTWAIAEEATDAEKTVIENDGEKEESFEDIIKDLEKFDGIFTLYRNNDDGSLLMELGNNQLNKEYIYFAFIQNGVLEAYSRRGAPIAEDVIEIRKHYDRIEFVKKNTNFYIDPNSTLANGGYANVSDAVLSSIKIKASSEDKTRHLIAVEELFQTEALAQITYNLDPEEKPSEQFNIGELSKDKTRYSHIGVYPENMNVRTDYVFNNPKPFVRGSSRLADARSTTITVQHSFLKMPNNDYVPRQDDARVGYFGAQITDLNSYAIAPYRDLISRWHLVKKNPEAALSEPLEPIVWWIENTTPHEYREILRQGVLRWNLAFEKAGFKNAIVVNIQADDAKWTADDVRYNVVRFSNTPGAGSAFGPSYINPRTGQILGADVMFEHSFLSGYGFRGDVFASKSSIPAHEKVSTDFANKAILCSFGHDLKEMVTFGRLALSAMDASVSEKRKIIEQMLYELMLHEVGHTLGLMHNMKASQFIRFDDVHNDAVTNGMTTASVMDYTALIIAPPGIKQGDFFTTKPGPYDDWAIQFGYDPELEGSKRDMHLARSTERALAFGNDADDMRSPGAAIDPYVNIWDMSDDAIGFAEQQFDLVDLTAPKLITKLSQQGETWAKIRAASATMISYKFRGTATIANYIGGVKVDRALQGQSGANTPYTPVDVDTQKRSMAVLRARILAPDAFDLPAELIAHSGMQRRGFEHYGSTEDPKIHAAILNVQQEVLNRLLNPVVMTRLSDTELYGNLYSVNDMMVALSSAVFEDDLNKDVNSKRQNLQIEYIKRLTNILNKDEAYDYRSKAATFSELNKILGWMNKSKRSDNATRAHRAFAAHLIEEALEND